MRLSLSLVRAPRARTTYLLSARRSLSHYSNWNSHPARVADEAAAAAGHSTERKSECRHYLAFSQCLEDFFCFSAARSHTHSLSSKQFSWALLTPRYQGNKIIIFNECSPLILITKKCARRSRKRFSSSLFFIIFHAQPISGWGAGFHSVLCFMTTYLISIFKFLIKIFGKYKMRLYNMVGYWIQMKTLLAQISWVPKCLILKLFHKYSY